MRASWRQTAIIVLVVALAGVGYFIGVPLAWRIRNGGQGCVLQLQKSVALPNISGLIDHMALDTLGQRLFVAAPSNGSIAIVDLASGQFVKSLVGLGHPHAVIYLMDSQRLYISTGGDGAVRVYDGTNFSLVDLISLSTDTDNMRLDPTSRVLYVGYGRGAIASINTSDDKVLLTTPLVGHPDAFQLDTLSKRIFVNLPTANYVAVIGPNGEVASRWPMLNATGNYALALDQPDGRLFVATRSPNQLLVIDTSDGSKVAAVTLSSDSDDVFYDGQSGCIYVSAGGGFVDVISQINPNVYSLVTRISTAPGARTSLYDPLNHRLFLAVPSSDHQGYIRVYVHP